VVKCRWARSGTEDIMSTSIPFHSTQLRWKQLPCVCFLLCGKSIWKKILSVLSMRSLLRACSKRKLSSLFFGYCDPSAKSTLFSVYGVVFNELCFDIQLINTGKETAEVTLNFTWAVCASLAWDNFFSPSQIIWGSRLLVCFLWIWKGFMYFLFQLHFLHRIPHTHSSSLCLWQFQMVRLIFGQNSIGGNSHMTAGHINEPFL